MNRIVNMKRLIYTVYKEKNTSYTVCIEYILQYILNVDCMATVIQHNVYTVYYIFYNILIFHMLRKIMFAAVMFVFFFPFF